MGEEGLASMYGRKANRMHTLPLVGIVADYHSNG
jgi:hypothetical protein